MPKFCPPGIPENCPVLPVLRDHVDGECDKCGKKLVGRQKRWCSPKCSNWAYKEFSKHHDWTDARKAARRRDKYQCVKCGSKEKLEVNHIEPLVGKGYGRSCHHHLENLQVLCHPCHVGETNRQRAERKAQIKPSKALQIDRTI